MGLFHLFLYTCLLLVIFCNSVLGIYRYIGHLASIPTDIPSNESEVVFRYNNMTDSFITPVCFRTLRHLNKLHLTHNELTELPNLNKTIKKSLGRLSVRMNRISHVDVTGYDSLRILSAAQNFLLVFPNLSSIGDTLEVLKVSFNYLTSVSEEDCSSLVNLQYLYLDGNLLKSFPSFQSIRPNLVYMNISSNPITALTGLDLSGFDWEGLLKLDMSDNDITCNCGIWFIKAMGSSLNIGTMTETLNKITCTDENGTHLIVVDMDKGQSWGFTSRSTARVILGQVLRIATCGTRTHRGDSL